MKANLKIFALTLLFLLSGCAQDRSLDDYKREQLRQYLGQYQSASGVFRGFAYSKIDQSTVGAIELILTAKIKPVDANSSSKADGAPILKGKINLYGTHPASIDAPDGFYDPDTGLYQANIPIRQQNSKITEISIAGKIDGSHFEGSIEVNGFPEYGSQISLERDAPLTQRESEGSSSTTDPGNQNSNVLGSFEGTTTFRSGATRSVSLVILSTRNSSEEDFLNLFNPVKTVQVTLNYGGSIQISHPNVEWNQQTHRMLGTASVVINNKNITLALECNQVALGTPQSGWTCQTSTANSGWIARTQVQPPTAEENHRPINSGDTEAILTQYQGTAQLLDGSTVPVTMSALFPPRSRESELEELFFPPAERLLIITVLFPVDGGSLGSHIPVTFERSRWDLKTHTLNGSSSSSSQSNGGSSIPNAANGVTLSCKNFNFNEGSAPFDCLFIPNRWGAPITLRLQK